MSDKMNPLVRVLAPGLLVLLLGVLLGAVWITQGNGARAQTPTRSPATATAETPTVSATAPAATATNVPGLIRTESPIPKVTSARDTFWLAITALLITWTVLVGLLLLLRNSLTQDKAVDWYRLARPVLEGVTLVMIVAAVIILGSQGSIGDQGIIAVLSAIVGFLLGRAVGAGGAGGSSP